MTFHEISFDDLYNIDDAYFINIDPHKKIKNKIKHNQSNWKNTLKVRKNSDMILCYLHSSKKIGAKKRAQKRKYLTKN